MKQFKEFLNEVKSVATYWLEPFNNQVYRISKENGLYYGSTMHGPSDDVVFDEIPDDWELLGTERTFNFSRYARENNLSESKSQTKAAIKEFIKKATGGTINKGEYYNYFNNQFNVPDNEVVKTSKGSFTGKDFSKYGGEVAKELDNE